MFKPLSFVVVCYTTIDKLNIAPLYPILALSGRLSSESNVERFLLWILKLWDRFTSTDPFSLFLGGVFSIPFSDNELSVWLTVYTLQPFLAISSFSLFSIPPHSQPRWVTVMSISNPESPCLFPQDSSIELCSNQSGSKYLNRQFKKLLETLHPWKTSKKVK